MEAASKAAAVIDIERPEPVRSEPVRSEPARCRTKSRRGLTDLSGELRQLSCFDEVPLDGSALGEFREDVGLTDPVANASRSSPLPPANHGRACVIRIGNAVWSGRSLLSRFTVRTSTWPAPSGRSKTQ